MYAIQIVRPGTVYTFAAEELKKYLRMMLPEEGDVSIVFGETSEPAFRLGLLEDFALPNEAADPLLDDVVHVETDENGGILAGSNPRSVLFAVYRLLRENGCRFLYPGVDGEIVPVKTELLPVSYHKMADHRFRGHCNEGAESQQCMLETIDFYAKQDINVYMLEFDNPFVYYNIYYTHKHNEEHRIPEPISRDQVKQWKRQCETEIAKRGLMFHDMGHGWTADPFGIDSSIGWTESTQVLTEEQKSCLALINGKRELWQGVPLNTNLCMSKPEVRSRVADSVVEYAKKHGNVTYLHVWLADGVRNQCECEECQKMRPSDFYMMILNEIDEKLEKAGLPTRIVFTAYQDTLFRPEKVSLKHPERFSLVYGPINRDYTHSINENTPVLEPFPYVRNAWQTPWTTEENYALLKAWEEVFRGPVFGYEYHFWRQQYHDPGFIYIARRIYEDVRGLRAMGMDGYVEDGSQRSFFPNGFPIYMYAATLWDREINYDEVRDDYFRHAYGDAWQEVLAYFEKVSDFFDFPFMSGKKSADKTVGMHYNPEQAERLDHVKELAEEGKRIAEAHLNMPLRVQTVSMRLLLRHSEYIALLAPCFAAKARNDNDGAFEAFETFRKTFGKYEAEMERYFDHGLAFTCHRLDMKRPSKILVTGQ